MDGKEDIKNKLNTWSDCSVVIPPSNELVMDYTNVFTTKDFLGTRHDLVNWVRTVAHEHGMVVVVRRSDNGGGTTGKKSRLVLVCERSGEYRRYKTKSSIDHAEAQYEVKNEEPSKRRRRVGTKKCACPFLMRGREIALDRWKLDVKCGIHNHPCSQELIAHRRLSEAEEKFVIDMSINSNSRPKDISIMLQQKFPDNKCSLKTIYNARLKHKMVEKLGKSQMQYLLGRVQEHGYICHDRRCEKTHDVKDIFFAHPTSIDILRAFPRVLLIDTYNYKTNKCALPLVEIVGLTSTGMTFQAACAYMESERDDNYVWAFGILKSLMDEPYFPNVIVTDGEIAGLMNAVETTFPMSRHLLCRWNISKSIMTICKEVFRSKEKWESFNASWDILVYADTESKFNELLRRFKGDYAQYPAALEYVMSRWVEPHKERFVSAWTNDVMHFNNTTTNRAEGHHSILKKQLASSMGNFESCWTEIHTLLETSHDAIKSSFEASIVGIDHLYRSNVFKSLRGAVSIEALSKISDEMRGIPDGDGRISIDRSLCGCVLRKTCGLPCAHEIAECVREDKPIPLNMVDSFWRKLSMNPIIDVGVSDDVYNRWFKVIANLNSVFEQSSGSEKLLMLERMEEAITFL